MFVLEDEFHGEREGEFETFDYALSEVHKRAEVAAPAQPLVSLVRASSADAVTLSFQLNTQAARKQKSRLA